MHFLSLVTFLMPDGNICDYGVGLHGNRNTALENVRMLVNMTSYRKGWKVGGENVPLGRRVEGRWALDLCFGTPFFL